MLHSTKHGILIKVGKCKAKKKKKDFLSHYWVDGEKKSKQNGLFRIAPVQFVSYIGNVGKVSFEQQFHG